MKVAIYHNLPPGGALRVLHDFVRRSHDQHQYDLYTVDLGRFDVFAYGRNRAERHDMAPYVAHSFRYPVVPRALAGALSHAGWVVTAPYWMDRVHRRIASDIDRRGYDVALVHPCQVTHTPSVLRYLATPSLCYMHEYRRRSFEAEYQRRAPGDAWPRRLVVSGLERTLRGLDRAAVRSAHRIACNSTYTAECLWRSYGRDATVCYPGVDDEVFTIRRGVDEPRSVMTVGALEAVKGHDLVVRALSLLPAGTRPALDVVYERCDQAYRAELERLAAARGVSLRLHTGISDADLAALYGAAAATVVTARLEPLGLAPLESLACGTPVVAVREAGYRETVDDGVNGYLVERTAPAVAEGVARILAGRLGRTAEELRATVVPRWSWNAAVKRQLEELAHTASRPRS